MTKIFSYQCLGCHQEFQEDMFGKTCKCGFASWVCHIIEQKTEEVPAKAVETIPVPKQDVPKLLIVKSASRGRPRYSLAFVDSLIAEGKSSRAISAELKTRGINVSFRTVARRMREKKQGILV